LFWSVPDAVVEDAREDSWSRCYDELSLLGR
jgi:hypothetical protein